MNPVSIGSDNGLSPIRRQAIIETNARLLSDGPLGTHSSEISIKIQFFSFTKMHLKISSVKCRPFCPGVHELKGGPVGGQLRDHSRGRSLIFGINDGLDMLLSKQLGDQ